MSQRVADYPRPPRIEPSPRLVRIRFGGAWVAETRGACRVLETFHPPSWYLPPEAFRLGVLRPAAGSSFCEWKGLARYWDLAWNGRTARRAAWSYPDPTPGFDAIRDRVAVYAGLMQECRVDEELVQPQPGGFYGGWITADVAGPFKGGPGTFGW